MITHQQAEERVQVGFFIHLAAYVLVVGGLIALNFTRNPDKLWSIWVACGWGLGVILHGAGVFLIPRSRERAIQRTMERVERREARR
jgi:hypothetical protein